LKATNRDIVKLFCEINNRFLDNVAYFIISEINSRISYKFLTLTCVWKTFSLKNYYATKQKQDYIRPICCPYYPYSSCRGILRGLHYGILNGIVMHIKHIRSLYRGLQVKARVKRDDLCIILRVTAGESFSYDGISSSFLIFCCAQRVCVCELTYMSSYI